MYADDAGVGGNFEKILAHFQYLQYRGPLWGYFPEPTNIIFVVSPQNVAKAEELFRGTGMEVVTGIRYLVGFIGDRESEDRWLE